MRAVGRGVANGCSAIVEVHTGTSQIVDEESRRV